MKEVVVATRSSHKLREIAHILADLRQIVLLDLDDVGVAAHPEEDAIEAFDTFEENALAKARYFSGKTRLAVLADDSGLCVDALGGGPGVFSKRYSGRSDLTGEELDRVNNDRLIRDLQGVPATSRTARYVCVLALVSPGSKEQLFRGTVDGRILDAPRGTGGFGYDPLFFLPELDTTFAQLDGAQKNRISHRARALRAARSAILSLARESPSPGSEQPSTS